MMRVADGSPVVVSNHKVLCDPFEAACQVLDVPNSVDTYSSTKPMIEPPLIENLPYGETVWVAVAPSGEFHEIVRASRQRFEPTADEVLIRAETTWSGRGTDAQRLQYGLERYFVREGSGNPRGKITVQAVVPASGRARIKQVFLDGKPYAQAMSEAVR